MARYIYDARINTTITVEADTEEEAQTLAEAIFQEIELVDHKRDGTLEADLEDGLELMDVEDEE